MFPMIFKANGLLSFGVPAPHQKEIPNFQPCLVPAPFEAKHTCTSKTDTLPPDVSSDMEEAAEELTPMPWFHASDVCLKILSFVCLSFLFFLVGFSKEFSTTEHIFILLGP